MSGGVNGLKRALFRIRIYKNMMLDSTVVSRRALGCEWGGINKDTASTTGKEVSTYFYSQESSGTSREKERDMEAKASKHASKCEHACARARVCVQGGAY